MIDIILKGGKQAQMRLKCVFGHDPGAIIPINSRKMRA